MDTGSHLLFGATIAGLSHLQPEIAADQTLATAVLIAALAGSHAPDLDAVFKLRSGDAYLRHHREWSHSIPAMLLWPAAIGSAAAWALGAWDHWLTVFAWTLAAVVLHVLFDWTNAYGVKWLLPFKQKWYHLDALCLTDPLLMGMHGLIVVGWAAGQWSNPAMICLGAWAITAVYVGWRIVHHRLVLRRLRRRFRKALAIHVLPSLWWFRWSYVAETPEGFEMGDISGRRLLPAKKLPAAQNHECVNATLRSSAVKTLRLFSKRTYFSWNREPDGGYLVTWTDLRFWRQKDWPYRAEIRLDGQLNVVDQSIGWYKKMWEAPYV